MKVYQIGTFKVENLTTVFLTNVYDVYYNDMHFVFNTQSFSVVYENPEKAQFLRCGEFCEFREYIDITDLASITLLGYKRAASTEHELVFDKVYLIEYRGLYVIISFDSMEIGANKDNAISSFVHRYGDIISQDDYQIYVDAFRFLGGV